jgi:hypothetical protein
MRNLRKKFPDQAVGDVKIGFRTGGSIRFEGWVRDDVADVTCMLLARGDKLTESQLKLVKSLRSELLAEHAKTAAREGKK